MLYSGINLNKESPIKIKNLSDKYMLIFNFEFWLISIFVILYFKYLE